jgi:hypothetical protein
MKNNIQFSLLILSSIALLESCKPELLIPSVDKGSLNLSTYVAVGNSLTSGYADNALYYDGQKSSYAHVLAEQLKLAGGGEFKTPYVDPNSVGTNFVLMGTGIGTKFSYHSKLSLKYAKDCSGASNLGPAEFAPKGDSTILFTTFPNVATLTFPVSNNIYNSATYPGPYNNMGVPGAKAIDVAKTGFGNDANLVTLGAYNPFFARFAKSQTTSSMLSDAMDQKPTFFTLFIGNNDVLLYAASGGTQDAITPSAGDVGVGFDASIDSIVAGLTQTAKQGVIISIPKITSAPFFNYYAINTSYLIEDTTAPNGKRYMETGDYLLLPIPIDSITCGTYGTTTPIPNQYVLTKSEAIGVTNAVNAYNAKLKAVATKSGLAFLDFDTFVVNNQPKLYNGIELSSTFVSGNIFSLDGVHLTPRGYAALANEIIHVINAKYNSTIPDCDLTKLKGVSFPN